MKLLKYFGVALLLMSMSSWCDAQESTKPNQAEVGIFYGMGSSYDVWGTNANSFTKNRYHSMPEFGVYYDLPFSGRYHFKSEYVSRFFNSDILLGAVEGIASQTNVGLNLKLGKSFAASNNGSVDFYVGPGIYTVDQKRIPNQSTGMGLVNDGFGAYWGMSVEFELDGSMAFGNSRMGLAARLFFQPPFTISSKSDVPKYYHHGFSIAWFLAFK